MASRVSGCTGIFGASLPWVGVRFSAVDRLFGHLVFGKPLLLRKGIGLVRTSHQQYLVRFGNGTSCECLVYVLTGVALKSKRGEQADSLDVNLITHCLEVPHRESVTHHSNYVGR